MSHQRSVNSTLTRDTYSQRPGSALNCSSSKNLLLQHKIEGITSQLTSMAGTQAQVSPVAKSRGLNQNLNTLNVPYPVNTSSFVSLNHKPS